MVGSVAAGSESTGTTAAAPGCRTISSSPVEPSGKRTVSTSSVITRPLYTRIEPPSVLEQPGDGDLDALGENEARVASRAGADRGARGGRRVGDQAFARGDDPEPQHVKPVAHKDDAAAALAREPVGHAVDRFVARGGDGEGDGRLRRNAEVAQVATPDFSLAQRVACAHAASDEHDGGVAAQVQGRRVIQARLA